MGLYINPKRESKESFLEREGMEIPYIPKWNEIPKEHSAVVVVDNGHFTAAGIAFDKEELEAFTMDPDDKRPKRFFIIQTDKLFKVSNLESYLKGTDKYRDDLSYTP